MQTNRRNWLKQLGIVAAGVGLQPFSGLAAPSKEHFIRRTADGKIRLDSNENPYGPSPMARAAMAAAIVGSNRYNWDLRGTLIAAIAKKINVGEDNILLGAGSTEILDLMVRFSALEKGSFVVADPTFAYWATLAQKLGMEKITVPLGADKRNDLPAMLKAIKSDTKLLYLCNPNNPTGTICEREALLAFINKASQKTMVLVDEAYLDFTGQPSLCGQVATNKNIVIAKTFSKIYGMAGARVGYAIAHPETIERISRMQLWANGSVSVVSAAGALMSLSDSDFLRTGALLNEKAREYTTENLERLSIPCIPSHTNFIYFSLADYDKDFFKRLENNNIIGTRIYEEKGKWSRITVGTMEEMQAFIAAVA